MQAPGADTRVRKSSTLHATAEPGSSLSQQDTNARANDLDGWFALVCEQAAAQPYGTVAKALGCPTFNDTCELVNLISFGSDISEGQVRPPLGLPSWAS